MESAVLELRVLGCPEQDETAMWAAIAHQFRFHDDYVPLARPLPMHLAKLAEEYLSPRPADGGSLE